jgi:hypothetical protein
VNPDPLTATTDPPFRQVPGLTVSVGGPPVDVAEVAWHGTVVVVLPPDVVVVVLPPDVVVVVLPPDVVEVVLPPDVVVVPELNEIVAGVPCVPSDVPNSITHESPAVVWASVGGQG